MWVTILIGHILIGNSLTSFKAHEKLLRTMRRFVAKVFRNIFPRRGNGAIENTHPQYTPASKHPLKLFSYPELEQTDVENARLFARRENLLRYFAPRLTRGTIAEVGVMYGDFSDFILRTIEPELFVAIDIFDMHNMPVIWSKPSAIKFQGMTHREFYEKRFSARGKQVRCEEGDSYRVLLSYPNSTFDMIYIDAAHDYESVKKDADVSIHKIKPAGILIFNDYIRYSHYDDCYYGIVPVVNDLVVNQGFEVLGFALQCDMYCDIAIRRKKD
jgi:Methyltransferase domain